MAYVWKTYQYKTDANVAGKVCEELQKTIGLSAENLVNASRAEDAPLHEEFEWDNDVAAEEYRKVQAGNMIRNLSIVIEDVPTNEPVRAFFNLTRKSGLYENTIEIMTDRSKTEVLLNIALRELNVFKEKYKALKELADIFQAIDKVQSEHRV